MGDLFGWSYPAGVTDNDIDNAVGADDSSSLLDYEEWAGEAHQHFTSIFNRVTFLLARGLVRQEDAAFLLKEASDGQSWLENILMPDKKSEEHQQEYSFIPIFSPIFTVNALPSILWYNLEMAHVHMKTFARDYTYYTAKIEHICDILMQQNYNA